jgi:glycerophosphoryl diester phosphodiesterase
MPCTYPGNFRVGVSPLTRENITEMHDRDLALIHGDIDDESEMSRLIDLGLDGIITNYPVRLSRVFRNHGRGG